MESAFRKINTKSNLSITLNNVDMSNVETMKLMFGGCKNLKNINFININASKLISMENMFFSCTKMESAIFTNFVAPDLKSLNSMFYNCYKLKTFKLDGILENIDSSKIEYLDNMFFSCEELRNISLVNITFLELISVKKFISGTSKLENAIFKNLFFPKLVNISYMFYNFYSSEVTDISFENIYTSNLKEIKKMFSEGDCNTIEFKDINFEKLESMNIMFYSIYLEALTFENLTVPNLKILNSMFVGYLSNISFKDINFVNLLTMNYIVPNKIRYFSFININASKLTTLEYLFLERNYLQYVIFENVDISNAISMKGMFPYIDTDYFDEMLISFKNVNASNISYIEGFINGKCLNITLENIDFSNLTYMESVFIYNGNEQYGCKSEIN